MFCTNCGKPIEKDQKFCVHCGKPVEIAGDSSKPQDIVRPTPVVSQEPLTTDKGETMEEAKPDVKTEVKKEDTTYIPYRDYKSDKKGNKKWLLWIIIITITLGLAVTAYFTFGNIGKSSEAIEQSEVEQSPGSQVGENQNVPGLGNTTNGTDVTVPPFYVVNITAVEREDQAKAAVTKLESQGYKAGYLWIPDYASLSGAKYFSVYVGPFKTIDECAVAVEDYRKVNPKVYGTLVSHEPGRVQVNGIGKVNRTPNNPSEASNISVESLSNLPQNLSQEFGIGAGCSYSRSREGASVLLTNVSGDALMKINGKFVKLGYVQSSGTEKYSGGGYEVTVDTKQTGSGHEYLELEGWLTVKSASGGVNVKIFGTCGA